jgi:hypothetical protein
MVMTTSAVSTARAMLPASNAPADNGFLHRGFGKVERMHLAPADNLPCSHAAAHIAKADECDAGHCGDPPGSFPRD